MTLYSRSAQNPCNGDIDVPLLTNRYMVTALAKAMLGAGGLVLAMVGLLLGFQGAWHAIPGVTALLLGISVGLFALGLVVMAFPFKNRLVSHFAVDADGVHLVVTDRTARGGNRLAFWMGLALGSGATAGSGLLAATQEKQSLRWGGAFRAIAEPATRSIAFRNGWRTLLRVYCRPENFSMVVDRVNREMGRTCHDRAHRPAFSSWRLPRAHAAGNSSVPADSRRQRCVSLQPVTAVHPALLRAWRWSGSCGRWHGSYWSWWR